MRWIALLLLSGVLLTAAACGDDEAATDETPTPTQAVEATDTQAPPEPTDTQAPPEPTDTPAPSVTYTMDFSVSAAGGARIDVSGTANLPDGALIRVSASRAFRNQGEADVRVVGIAQNDVTVTGGEFSTSLRLDESDLLAVVAGGFDMIEIVSQGVTVCAEFATGEDFDGRQRQPNPSVVEAVGPFGERLADSPQLMVFGSATANPSNWLEVETSVGMEPPLLEEISALQGQAPTVGVLEGFCF